MKKLGLLSLVAILSLLLIGCGNKEEGKKEQNKEDNKMAQYESVMEEYVRDYYIRFSNKQITEPEVSLKSLKAANDAGYTSYDLSKLATCSDESKTKIKLKQGTNEIDGYVHELDCK